jgi:hypothetical protein
MKKLLPLLFLTVIIVLSSCDGRNKGQRTAEQDLIDNKVLDGFSEIIEYIPEAYVEVVTDTILSTGFHIKIKTSSDMNNNVLYEFEADSIRYKQFYRNYVGELNVDFEESTVLKKTIDKSLFMDSDPNFIWDDAIMGQITLDQENTSSKEVFLDVFYCLVESQICKDYKLIINTSGDLKIKY